MENNLAKNAFEDVAPALAAEPFAKVRNPDLAFSTVGGEVARRVVDGVHCAELFGLIGT